MYYYTFYVVICYFRQMCMQKISKKGLTQNGHQGIK